MKKYMFIFSLIVLILWDAQAQPMPETWQNWSSGTAFTLPAKRSEIGVFQAWRYGLTDKLELATHPIAFFIIPNADVKWSHGSYGNVKIASSHGITLPSPLLNTIARKGTGGIISPEFDIPFIFSIQNEMLASFPIHQKYLATLSAGFNFAFATDNLDSRTTIDLPVIFPRTQVYYQNYGFTLGGKIKGSLVKRWSYQVDVKTFYYPSAAGNANNAVEQSSWLVWTKNTRMQVNFGYLLSYAEYPFGAQWHLLPLFDVQWAFGKNQ